MSKSGYFEPRIPSSTTVAKRKSESLQSYNAASIRRRCTSSKGNWYSSNGEGRTKKKHKKANKTPVGLSANTSPPKGMDEIHLLDDFLNHLLPLQVQLDQHMVSGEVRVHVAGKSNSPLLEAVALEHVDTASNPQSSIGQVAREGPSLPSDPLQNELEKIQKETEELQKSHQDKMSGLKSQCELQMQELVAAARKRYELKFEDAQAQFKLKKNGANQNHNKLMDKLLGDAFSRMNMRPTFPPMQQEVLSGFRGFASSPPGFAAFWPQKAVKRKGTGRKNSNEEESGGNDVKVDKVPKKQDKFAYIKMMRYEYDILMRDPTNMAPQQLAAHQWLCEIIKLRRGL